MRIKRLFEGLQWQGEKTFLQRLMQLERLGFRRVRLDSPNYSETAFQLCLPEKWTFEVQPLLLAPTPDVRYITVRDQNCRRRVNLVEAGQDDDQERQLLDIWLLTFYSIQRFNAQNVHKIAAVNECGDILHSQPLNEFNYGQHQSSNAIETWLDQNHPRWNDPFAYWDD